MNSFLKYIIYFLLGLMITFLLKDKLIEGYGENGFQLLARIIGQNEQGDSRTQYSGCQIYECDNKHNYDNLESKTLEELKDILINKLNETRLIESEINVVNKNNLIREIIKINKANYYVDKEYSNDLDYLICNNEMDYSPASLLGDSVGTCANGPLREGPLRDFIGAIGDDTGARTSTTCEASAGVCHKSGNLNYNNTSESICLKNDGVFTSGTIFTPTFVDNRCNHEKCCFNAKCSSEDVMNLNKNCNPGVLNKEANCFNLEGCQKNFQSLCCTTGISEISEDVKIDFYKIDKGIGMNVIDDTIIIEADDDFSFDDRKISLSKIKDYYSLTESDILYNILSIKHGENEDIELDIYEFDNLFNK